MPAIGLGGSTVPAIGLVRRRNGARSCPFGVYRHTSRYVQGGIL